MSLPLVLLSTCGYDNFPILFPPPSRATENPAKLRHNKIETSKRSHGDPESEHQSEGTGLSSVKRDHVNLFLWQDIGNNPNRPHEHTDSMSYVVCSLTRSTSPPMPPRSTVLTNSPNFMSSFTLSTHQVQCVLRMYSRTCDLPLECGWPTSGHTLEEN